MKNLIFTFYFLLGVMLTLHSQTYSGGSGTLGDPYQIANKTDLKYLSEHSAEWTKHFIQTADISFTASDYESGGDFYNSGGGFIPIGNLTTKFTGSYNGQGFVINALFINRSTSDYQAMFGYLYNSLVKDLVLTNVNITGKASLAGLVGSAEFGTIRNCLVTGKITGIGTTADFTGGLIGDNRDQSVIEYCYTNVQVSGKHSVGALAGRNLHGGTGAIIRNCYSTGSVSSTGDYSGGLVGVNSSTISNCYSLASVAGYNRVGGFVGFNWTSSAKVEYCYSTGAVSGSSYLGGLIGTNEGAVNNSFWDTQTSGRPTSSGGTGKTTAEMKTQSTFTNAGWNFTNVWLMSPSFNSGYAHLYGFETFTWDGSESSSWNTAANWDQNIVPSSTDDVIIANAGTAPVIASGTGFSCNNLTINAGASLIINSGGSLITYGAITNNGTMQISRTLTESIWHMISVPVEGVTANSFLGDYLQSWDEANGVWVNITDPLTALNTKQGYSLWATPGKSNHTYTFTGTLLTGDQSTPITYHPVSGKEFDGANLLSNPYPSSIDWDQLQATYGSNYIWDGTAYKAYSSQVGYDLGYRYIPPMQGFFIITNASGNFNLTNVARTHEGAANFYKSSGIKSFSNGIVLETSNGSYTDEWCMVFDPEASESFELPKDALKLLSGTPGISQLWSVGTDGKMAIDIRPETQHIQLGFSNSQSGIYTISLKEMADIDNATLEDTKTGVLHNLADGAYEFAWDVNDAQSRFKLHLNSVGIEETPISKSNILIYTANNQIFITGAENGEVLVSDMMGRVVLRQEISDEKSISVPESLQTGVYLVTIQNGKEIKTGKVLIK